MADHHDVLVPLGQIAREVLRRIVGIEAGARFHGPPRRERRGENLGGLARAQLAAVCDPVEAERPRREKGRDVADILAAGVAERPGRVGLVGERLAVLDQIEFHDSPLAPGGLASTLRAP